MEDFFYNKKPKGGQLGELDRFMRGEISGENDRQKNLARIREQIMQKHEDFLLVRARNIAHVQRGYIAFVQDVLHTNLYMPFFAAYTKGEISLQDIVLCGAKDDCPKEDVTVSIDDADLLKGVATEEIQGLVSVVQEIFDGVNMPKNGRSIVPPIKEVHRKILSIKYNLMIPYDGTDPVSDTENTIPLSPKKILERGGYTRYQYNELIEPALSAFLFRPRLAKLLEATSMFRPDLNQIDYYTTRAQAHRALS